MHKAVQEVKEKHVYQKVLMEKINIEKGSSTGGDKESESADVGIKEKGNKRKRGNKRRAIVTNTNIISKPSRGINTDNSTYSTPMLHNINNQYDDLTQTLLCAKNIQTNQITPSTIPQRLWNPTHSCISSLNENC